MRQSHSPERNQRAHQHTSLVKLPVIRKHEGIANWSDAPQSVDVRVRFQRTRERIDDKP